MTTWYSVIWTDMVRLFWQWGMFSSLSLMILLGLLKCQVFLTLRHASWHPEISSYGNMDASSDWGICSHSLLDATKDIAAKHKLIHVLCLSISLSFQSWCVMAKPSIALYVKRYLLSTGQFSWHELSPLFTLDCWRDFVVTARGAAVLPCWSF